MSKQVKKQEALATLITTEEVAIKFKELANPVNSIQKIAKEIKIHDEDSLLIANGHLDTARNLEKQLKAIEDSLYGPYYRTSRMIKDYTKIFFGKIKDAKDLLSVSALKYQNLKQAQAKAKEEARLKEVQENSEKMRLNSEKLDRIGRQICARLYGGAYSVLSVDNEIIWKDIDGCRTEQDVANVEQFVESKYPDHDLFGELKSASIALYNELLNKIGEYRLLLRELSDGDEKQKDVARKDIERLKNKSQKEIEEMREKNSKFVKREEKKEIRESNEVIKSAGKGIRKNVKFHIDDIKKVPHAFLQLNEQMVKNYQSKHLDEIKQRIENNEGDNMIDGIIFYYDKKYV